MVLRKTLYGEYITFGLEYNLYSFQSAFMMPSMLKLDIGADIADCFYSYLFRLNFTLNVDLSKISTINHYLILQGCFFFHKCIIKIIFFFIY